MKRITNALGDLGLKRKQFVIRELRRASYKWPARGEALKEARVERGIYKCNSCEGSFGNKDIQLDHIDPLVDPSTGFLSWDHYIQRLFVAKEGWQVLCRPCHKIKTDKENEQRKRK